MELSPTYLMFIPEFVSPTLTLCGGDHYHAPFPGKQIRLSDIKGLLQGYIAEAAEPGFEPGL